MYDEAIEYITSHKKFAAADLLELHKSDLPLFEKVRASAYTFLQEYSGNFEFLVWAKTQYLMNGRLDLISAAKLLNCMQYELSKRPTIQAGQPIENGIYTLGNDERGSNHITLRIIPDWRETEAAQGKQVAQFLSGNDNEHDYTGFAFIDVTKIAVWKSYRDNQKLVDALKALMASNVEERREMGYNYAKESNRCWRCGKPLTVPASQTRGLGPICYEKIYG